jgi:hypothetical protein
MTGRSARKIGISRESRLGRTISLFSAFSPHLDRWKTGIHWKLNRIEGSVRQLRESHRVSQFSGLALGLSFYSYRVRELVSSWLFFIIIFVVLALLVLGAVFAWYVVIRLSHWIRTTTPGATVLVLASTGVPTEAISAEVPARNLRPHS